MTIHTRRRLTRVVALFAASTMVAAACGGDDDAPVATDVADDTTETTAAPDDDAGDTTETTAAPDDDDTTATTAAPDDSEAAEIDLDAEFRYASSAGVTSWDPHRTASAGDMMFHRLVYDRLIAFHVEDGVTTLMPQIATEWEFSDDQLSLSLTLRDDAMFQDGTPLDAAAVVANFDRMRDEQSTVSRSFAAVESVEAVDATHVTINLSKPDPLLPYILAARTNSMMVNPAAFDSDLGLAPAGSGPFTLAGQTDAEVTFERWDDHWDPEAGLVKTLTYLTVVDPAAGYNSVLAGELDAVLLANPYDAESLNAVEDGFQRINDPSAGSFGILINSDRPPLDDVRVRKAISMAINRPEIATTLLGGIYDPAYQTFLSGIPGYLPELDVDNYDPEAARALIQEAGADGATLEMIQTTSEPQGTLAQVVQAALADIGLNTNMTSLGAREHRGAWSEGTFDLAVTIVTGDPDPVLTLQQSYIGGNNPATPPAELMELFGAAAAIPLDDPNRAAAFEEINRWLAENPIHVPIARFNAFHLAGVDVINADTLTGPATIDLRYVGKAGS